MNVFLLVTKSIFDGIAIDNSIFSSNTARVNLFLQKFTFYVCSMARINNLSDRSMDKRNVRGLVPCWGQDGSRAHVPQRPIDSSNI